MEPQPLLWVEKVVLVPAKPLLTQREVCLYLEVGRDALKELIAGGQFPRPILVSAKTQRWRAEWVRWFLDARDLLPRLVAEPDAAGAAAADSGGLERIGADSKVLGGKRAARPEGG